MTDQQAAALAVLNACHRDLERAMTTGSYSLGLLAELAHHAFNGSVQPPPSDPGEMSVHGGLGWG